MCIVCDNVIGTCKPWPSVPDRIFAKDNIEFQSTSIVEYCKVFLMLKFLLHVHVRRSDLWEWDLKMI